MPFDLTGAANSGLSTSTLRVFNENAQAAIDAATGYLSEIRSVLNALGQAVKTDHLGHQLARAYCRTACRVAGCGLEVVGW